MNSAGTTLYRCVSVAEMIDVQSSGTLRATAGSLEGKWFAEKLEDARKWGEFFTRQTGVDHGMILKVQVSRSVADAMVRREKLDGIGPARFATIAQLTACSPEGFER